MRVLFLGTPEFAVPTLEKLLAWPHGQVVGLVTQPDRPSGRGNIVQPPPTKVVAQASDIPVFQPEKLSKSPETVESLRQLVPDILVMVAFGQILKKSMLEMAPYGVLNLHGSLLPKYRGPAPINWAIINGETKTGATTMFSDAGVDTGLMLLKQEIPIGTDTTAPELAEVMSRVGADLVMETLEGIKAGSAKGLVQDESQATYASLLKREMGLIDWTKSALQIHNLVRGLLPWPGTYTYFQGGLLKVMSSSLQGIASAPVSSQSATLGPGAVVSTENNVVVACGPSGEERIALLTVQPANRPRLSGKDWANGVRLKPGTRLGQ